MPGAENTLRRRNLPPVSPRRRVARIVHSADRSAVGRIIEIDRTDVVLGRQVEGPGGIADGRMSREHLQIRAGDAPHELLAADLGTSNGSFLNGERLIGSQSISAGTVISVGDTLLVIDQEPDPDLLPASAHADDTSAYEVVGVSLAAQRLRASIKTAARARGAVLLLGETGTGKEVAARAIHRLSETRTNAWVPVNCAAIPAEIAEAELFGHRRGAFTGAGDDREGFFAQAAGGTLFLDEIGDLPGPLQAKLLRALEDGTIQPLGGGPPQTVDARVIAATQVDLSESGFRRDLYARLGDWVLHIPPLSERRADILVLWEHFVAREAETSNDARRFESTPELAEALLLHAWPMNVRELAKLARRVASMGAPGEPLDLPLLPEQLQAPIRTRAHAGSSSAGAAPKHSPRTAPKPPNAEVEMDPEEVLAPETAVLENALREAKGNVSKVAELLGAHRTQVYRWLRRRRLDADRYRE